METKCWHLVTGSGHEAGRPICQIPPAIRAAGGVCEHRTLAAARKAAKLAACDGQWVRIRRGACPLAATE